MTKALKKRLDYIPLLILAICAFYTLWVYFDEHVQIKWQHILGFCMIVISGIIFFINHKLGVLLLGLTIIIGLVGLISLNPGITTATIGKSIDGESITFLRFQPIFILWATIHFLISGRFYTGIANAKYWSNIKSEEPFRID